MANFVMVVDRDGQRRSQFITTLQPKIAPMDGLVVQTEQCGDFSVIWAAHDRIPLSVACDAEGLSIIWGEAMPPGESDRVTAQDLRRAWAEPPGAPYDGFYAACRYVPGEGLQVGVDLLGFFPLYYAVLPDVVLVGSSPELFQDHPLFTPQLSLTGFVGLLLVKGVANGQALWEGVKRLGMGHVLTVSPDLWVQEVEQYRVPCFQADLDRAGYDQLPFDEQIELLEAAVGQAIRRHAPAHEPTTLLLSGGLDSRMLAGFLHRQGNVPQTLTFGRPDDLESLCARPIARFLGFPHNTHDDPLANNVTYAHWLATWEHVSGGGNGLAGTGWGSLEPLRQLPARTVTGLSMDRVICGIRIRNPDFWGALAQLHSGAFTPDQLAPLLNRDRFQGVAETVVAGLQQRYQQYSDLETHRAWLLSLAYSNRMGLGMHAWRMTFGTWPCLPILDQQVLAVGSQLPSATTSKRRAQKALVQRSFPQLAQLPLDHNGFSIQPLTPSRQSQRWQQLARVRSQWWKLQAKLGYERRYYYRIFNINNPGLRAVRREVEPYRDAVSDLFNREALDTLLPPPEVPIPIQSDQITETKQYTLLLGLILWAGQHR